MNKQNTNLLIFKIRNSKTYNWLLRLLMDKKPLNVKIIEEIKILPSLRVQEILKKNYLD